MLGAEKGQSFRSRVIFTDQNPTAVNIRFKATEVLSRKQINLRH